MNPRSGSRRWFRFPWRSAAEIAAEVDEEIAFHLDMRTDELARGGVPASAARAQAKREFGDLHAARRALQDADGAAERRRRLFEWVSDLGLDVRFAVRSLARSPQSSLAAVLTLGLGIAVTVAVFGLLNWILLRPVPGVVAPEQLALVQMRSIEDPLQETGLSYRNFAELAESAPGFSDLAGYARIGIQAAAEHAAPEVIAGAAVAGDYFGTLGIRPALGRLLAREETGGRHVGQTAVISDQLWSTLFARDPEVLGRRVKLNGVDFGIVGVTPPGFQGTERLGGAHVWVPVSTYSLLRHSEDELLNDREAGILFELVGRLRPDATAALVEAQLRAGMRRLVETHPEENEIHSVYVPTVFEGIGLSVRVRDRVAETLRLMLITVAVVLVIACANVANLLLFRGVRRRGEVAVRRALGASAGRILREHMAAGVVLALSGGALGSVLALSITSLFRGQRLLGLPPIDDIGVDWRVLGFALAVSLATGVLFGVIPAWAAQREDFLAHLKDVARTTTGRAAWLRRIFTVAQISAALVMLIGALLLGRTLYGLTRVELGFDADQVLTFGVDPGGQGYTPEQNHAFRAELLARVTRLPGIESVSLADDPPFGGGYFMPRVGRPETPDAEPLRSNHFSVTPEYFSTLGIPIVAGQGFAARGSEEGVVISRELARQLFGEQDPVGRQVSVSREPYTVLGVTGDVRVKDLRSEPDQVVYAPISEMPEWRSQTTVLLRSRLSREETEASVRQAIASIDPALALYGVATISEGAAQTIAETRLLTGMVAFLAILAVVLAAVGLYAVIAYSVAQRTREIGIRMALGARAGAVVRLIAGEAGHLALAGTLLGAFGGWWLSRLLESRLFGVEALDPAVYMGAGALVTLVAVAATAGPARTATRVDPMVALRAE